MPAQVAEKIGVAPQGFAGEHGFERGKEQRFGLVLRLVGCGVVHRRRKFYGFERFAVDFARQQPGQAFGKLIAHGHHVGGQAHLERIAQVACRRWRLGAAFVVQGLLGHEPGHELVDAVDLAHQHGGGADAGLLAQRGFDFAQLHAKTANLDLVVGAAQALHGTVFLNFGQVAGAVQPRFACVGGPRVGQKFFGGQIRPAQIALRYTGADDAQLARFALRHGALLVVEHQHAVVGQRPADGDGLVAAQLRQTGRHGGFGGPVGVENLQAQPVKPRHQRVGAHFAAQVDDAQIGHLGAK